MPIKEKLTEELKTAMRGGDHARRDALRMLLASIKQAEVDNIDPSKRNGGMSDEEVVVILTREAKRRREAIEGFEKGGATERADQERSELALIETYLPKQMDRAAIESLARAAIAASGAAGPAQQGAVMQKLMPQLKGKADGKLVSQIVKELLTGS